MKYLQLIIVTMLLYPLSSYAYSHLSPYSYCGGNPVNCVDPTGCVIEGVTKKMQHWLLKILELCFQVMNFLTLGIS